MGDAVGEFVEGAGIAEGGAEGEFEVVAAVGIEVGRAEVADVGIPVGATEGSVGLLEKADGLIDGLLVAGDAVGKFVEGLSVVGDTVGEFVERAGIAEGSTEGEFENVAAVGISVGRGVTVGLTVGTKVGDKLGKVGLLGKPEGLNDVVSVVGDGVGGFVEGTGISVGRPVGEFEDVAVVGIMVG